MTSPDLLPVVPARYLARVNQLLSDGQRKLLGLVGPPGAGKSALARALRNAFASVAEVVPVDGFQLSSAELRRLGRAGRRGAADTYDSAGYAALMKRLRHRQGGEIIYAPEFRREIEEPIAGAIPILAQVQLVITEGNYLLLDDGHWGGVGSLLDEVWYVEIDEALRAERLVQRHQRDGCSRQAAENRILSSDAPNARLVSTTRRRAGFVFHWDDDSADPAFQTTVAAPL